MFIAGNSVIQTYVFSHLLHYNPLITKNVKLSCSHEKSGHKKSKYNTSKIHKMRTTPQTI